MKAATAKQIKDELSHRSPQELTELCLRLSRFKKENKELLTYLLFEAADEDGYVAYIKEEIDEQFVAVNKKNWYFIKKNIRKILSNVRKHIRYSQSKETDVRLRIYFCEKLKGFQPSIQRNKVLKGLYERQLDTIQTAISKLHEDLQYDYGEELKNLS